jgi:hypothetical protein
MIRVFKMSCYSYERMMLDAEGKNVQITRILLAVLFLLFAIQK